MFEEFKKFILKGNMVDLAVGVIIGGAFGKVVEKFTECIMSAIGKALTMVGADKDATNFDSWSPGGIKIGAVITQGINLCLVGFALFLFIKAYNRFLLKPKVDGPPPPPSATEKLLAEIRDELKKQSA
jgi:large conductance mechanosensitive channel